MLRLNNLHERFFYETRRLMLDIVVVVVIVVDIVVVASLSQVPPFTQYIARISELQIDN